ncbi:MAG: PA2778 family cysteine peptidase [Gammaproteobacteria bacterium]
MLCLGSLLFLCACSTTLQIDKLRQSAGWDKLPRCEVDNVPFFPQQEYQCGPAALATLLKWAGVPVTPDDLVPLVYVPERQGSFQAEMVAAARYYDRIPFVIKPGFPALLDELKAGHPVLVFQNLGLDWIPRWHYAVVTGMDPANDEIMLNSGTIQQHVISLETFERTWRRAKLWAMVVMRPGEMPASVTPLQYVKAVAYFERKGKLALADTAYRAAVKRWPRSLVSLMALGNVCYLRGQLQQAQQFYRQVLDVKRDYAPAHNNLAQVLMEQGNLTAAQRHAQQAVQLGGEYVASYRDTLSHIEQRLASVPSDDSTGH